MMKRVFSVWLLLAAGLLLIMGAESCSNEEEKESEESNQNPAETELHKMYSSGVDLINPQQGEPNYSQALEIFKDAANKGDDSSMLATALLYEYGLGAKQDLNSALEYYKKAAEQGSEVAREKVQCLSNTTGEQNKIVFPKESDYTYNEVYITSSNEGIQLVNGNATFVASGSCIKAMDGCGSPLYYSFNNVGHKSKVTLDSKETAASLLIAVLPYVLSEKVDDQTFDKFKNDVKALPLTQQLAKKIDECIVNTGFLNADVIAADYEQAVDELLNLLFEENSNIQSKTIRQSYDKVVPYAKSKAGESGFGGGGSVRVWGENDPPILVLGNDELSGQKISNQSVEFELKESKYDDVKDVWNCKFTITNSYNPFYIAVNKVKLPVTEETVLNGIETYDMLENVIGPFVAPDVLSLKGTWQYVSGSFEGLWDLVTKHELNDYFSPTKDYSIVFESEYDAIAVTSFDSNYPQLIVYYIVKDLAFPLIEKIIEDKITADPSDEYATEAIKALVTKLVLNDKVVKAVWKLKQMMVNGSSDEEVFYAFTSLWDEMLDVFKEYILDELKDGVTGVWIQNASGQMVLSEKGLGLYGTVEKTFGPGLSSVFGGITEARDAAASSLGVWVTAYKNARKAYKALQPLTGFSFKPFTVSVSPKCFAHNNPVVTPGSVSNITIERKYLVHWNNNYCSPDFKIIFDNDKHGVRIGYDNEHYVGASGLILYAANDVDRIFDEELYGQWNMGSVLTDEWVNEKIVFTSDGNVAYYQNGSLLLSESVSVLGIKDAKSIRFDFNPYGWWTGHYHHMDDLKVTINGKLVIDDTFDYFDYNVWEEPVNPDGVKTEDGIMRMEQNRTDQDYHLRSKPISLVGY